MSPKAGRSDDQDNPPDRAVSRLRRHHRRRPDPAKPMSSSVAPPELHRRPESANNNPLKRTGAAGDLTIVRPAAAAPPRRPEQVGRHRPPNLARARDPQRIWSTLAPPELHRRPESANNNPLKRTGAAGDLTIGAASSRCTAQAARAGRSAPAQPLARCLDRQRQARKRDRLVAPVELWRWSLNSRFLQALPDQRNCEQITATRARQSC
jgi:hypothetical protein